MGGAKNSKNSKNSFLGGQDLALALALRPHLGTQKQKCCFSFLNGPIPKIRTSTFMKVQSRHTLTLTSSHYRDFFGHRLFRLASYERIFSNGSAGTSAPDIWKVQIFKKPWLLGRGIATLKKGGHVAMA